MVEKSKYCNISINYKIPIVFHKLKKYDADFIKQELRKFDFKTNFVPNGLEKCMKFSLDNTFFFIDSFQFLTASFNSLVKSLGENEFDSEVLDLVKQKGFYC